MLAPVRRLWRDAQTVQLGTDPDRAMILAGLPPGAARLLSLLDGKHLASWLAADAHEGGVRRPDLSGILSALRGAGLLDDRNPASELPERLPDAIRRRLWPELVALRLTAPGRAGKILAARMTRRVLIHGDARLAVPLASLLAAAGVLRLRLDLSGQTTGADVLPGGLRPSDRGRLRTVAASDAVHATSPEADLRTLSPRVKVDLAISIGPVGMPANQHPLAVRRAAAHLCLGVRDGVPVVGPLVIPGETTCLQCVDLGRTDRDHQWPALAAQLATDPPPTNENAPADPCPAAMALAAVSLTAMQALEHLDGGQPATRSTSLEISGSDLSIRRRRWSPHPACGCMP